MTRIIIRCDASLAIGSGHVIRCRTLARELQRRGAEVLFLCRRQSGDLIGLLEQEFRVLALPEQPLALCEGLAGRELYGAWLGCGQIHDAHDCLTALASAGVSSADWLVVDHYGLDASWEARLLDALAGDKDTIKLLAIDDLADRAHNSDLLLDQNFFGALTEQRYEELVPSPCRQLLGPHYALLGPEYAQLRPVVPKRTGLCRVLVFFGGVDPDNLTGRTLEALLDPALAHLAVDVVLGRQSPHRQAVADLVAQRPFTTLHGPLLSLAGLIARADLAIGAGGATTWERACLKLPSLVVAIAENQRPFAEALHQAGHLQLLGDAANVSSDQIRLALLARVNEPWQQRAEDELTDGLGALRLATAMLGPHAAISLQPVDAGHEALLLRWANDLQVRASSFASDPIAPIDHSNWFCRGVTDPNRLQLIAVTADGCPVGQICFDRQPRHAQCGTAEVIVYFSLDRCARGFGLTADLLRQGLEAMEQAWGPEIDAVNEVPTSNSAGKPIFTRPGIIRKPHSPVLGFEKLAYPPSRISILSDRGSWLNRYLSELIQALWKRGHSVRWIHHPSQLVAGDVCFLLSCGRLLSAEQIALHRHNLVVHESALPKGQGWSPMTWQILEGSKRIPITLFDAVAELDAGPIYLQQQIDLEGHELVDDWRALQAKATLDICLDWLDRYHEVVAEAQPQLGEPSYYRRRLPKDSQLDPELSLVDQFNLLRVVDNIRYPAFFNFGGSSFQLHLTRENKDV